MKLIVGLGNPGSKFTNSRHNTGFKCVDYLARKWSITLAERRAKAMLGFGCHDETPVVLVKPRTFMNASGEGVKYLLSRFPATPGDLVVIYDDMDLPTGKIRLRPSGGAAGHNGIDSIIDALGTAEFPRVRVGIGRPSRYVGNIEYVLGPFLADEKLVIEEAVEGVADAVSCLLREGMEIAMNRFN